MFFTAFNLLGKSLESSKGCKKVSYPTWQAYSIPTGTKKRALLIMKPLPLVVQRRTTGSSSSGTWCGLLMQLGVGSAGGHRKFDISWSCKDGDDRFDKLVRVELSVPVVVHASEELFPRKVPAHDVRLVLGVGLEAGGEGVR